ncbi:hypothetical protein [Jidongwangia harbinensis]|uniref:hypothetical protein n=1 Tax=Jidongwangia harbinensis TaxID=2878561 RepID=UPI002342E49A|nr:hypothetical protein [Jidongwangia harbinensis]
MKLFTLRRSRRSAVETGGVLPGSPDAVDVGGRSVHVGDDYSATLAVTGYPA